jgi:hypothetical protein
MLTIDNFKKITKPWHSGSNKAYLFQEPFLMTQEISFYLLKQKQNIML